MTRLTLSFVCIVLIQSCSWTLPDTNPASSAYRLLVDPTREVSDSSSSLHISATDEDIPVVLKTKLRSGHLDRVRFSLKDSLGVNTDRALEQFPADDDWVFYAINSDKEWVKARLSAEIWRQLGRWSPRLAKVELSLNGQEPLWWILSETVSRSDFRVDLKKLLPDEISSYRMLGGYLYGLAQPNPLDSTFDFLTMDGLVGTYQYPQTPSLAQRYTLESWHNELESSLRNTNTNFPNRRPEDFADLSAFADWIIAGELVGLEPFQDFNPELSKDRDGKISPVSAPDYRRAFEMKDKKLVLRTIPLIDHMLTYPTFRVLLLQRWNEVREGQLSGLVLYSKLEALLPEAVLAPEIRALMDRATVVDSLFSEALHG